MRAFIAGLVSMWLLAACRQGAPSATRDATASADLTPADGTTSIDQRPPATTADAARADSAPAPADAASTPADVAGAPVVDASPILGCPGAEAYVGNTAWMGSFEVKAPSLRRCAAWVGSGGNSSATLTKSFTNKAIATVAPGRYPVPDASVAPAAFRVPLCFLRSDGKTALPATGTIRTRGAALDVQLPLAGQGVVVASLQGSPLELRSLWICQDETCQPGQIVFFGPCGGEGFTPEGHKLVLEGGEVEVEVAIDRRGGGLGTEAAEFTRATGTFKGVAFDQRDYFKLVYSPEHHHFVRHFAVLFDAPIDGACGLWLENLAPRPGITPLAPRVFRVDCQLKQLGEVKVIAPMLAAH